MRWLLVGFTHKELREQNYKLDPDVTYVTLDRGDDTSVRRSDIDFNGDAFDIATWNRIMSTFGPKSFDIIFTDGGMFGIKRDDNILKLKHLLLKDTGGVVNFTSPLGRMVRCPFGRPYQFSYIPKKDYVIDKMDFALKNLRPDKLSNVLKSQLKILI